MPPKRREYKLRTTNRLLPERDEAGGSACWFGVFQLTGAGPHLDLVKLTHTTIMHIPLHGLRGCLNPKPMAARARRRPVPLNATASRSACFAKQIESTIPDLALLAMGHRV